MSDLSPASLRLSGLISRASRHTFGTMLDGQGEWPSETAETLPLAQGRQASATVRSFVPLNSWRMGTLFDRSLRWLLPWEFREYPGIARGAAQALPLLSSWTIRAVRRGRRRLMPHVAAHLADMIEADCQRGMALVAELRAVEAEPNRVPKGFREVKDWGDGVVTDARGKRRRARKV